MSTIRRIAAAVSISLVTVALVAGPASASSNEAQSKVIAKSSKLVAESTISLQDRESFNQTEALRRLSIRERMQKVAKATTARAQRGEGVIRITTRVCGSAAGWQNVAAANNITPPVYLVLLDQSLTVSCGAARTPVTTAPAPAPAPVVAAATTSGWGAPLPGYGNGNCNYWEWRGSYNHRGEDIPAPSGTPIRAVAGGTVSTGWDNGAGNYTVIRHDGGVASVYMHQSSFEVRSGWVNAGQIIGYVGSTGNSSGPHLHFEIQPWGPWNGVTDPIQYLAERGVSLSC